MGGLSVSATTIGIGLITIGLFAKKPISNFMAMCSDYQAAYSEEDREQKAQM